MNRFLQTNIPHFVLIFFHQFQFLKILCFCDFSMETAWFHYDRKLRGSVVYQDWLHVWNVIQQLKKFVPLPPLGEAWFLKKAEAVQTLDYMTRMSYFQVISRVESRRVVTLFNWRRHWLLLTSHIPVVTSQPIGKLFHIRKCPYFSSLRELLTFPGNKNPYFPLLTERNFLVVFTPKMFYLSSAFEIWLAIHVCFVYLSNVSL